MLEQCYISHYKPKLNGSRNTNVIFNFSTATTNCVNLPLSLKEAQPSLRGCNGKLKVEDAEEFNASKLNIYKAIDKNQVVVATSNSMNALASKLDISLAGLKYHLGRESYVNTKSLKCTVKIVKEGVISFGQTKLKIFISLKKSLEII